MEAMKLFKSRTVQLAKIAGWEEISSMTLLVAAEIGIYFLLAAVLSGGVLFESYSPLGVAVVAGAGAGLCGGGALLGAGLGYLTLLGLGDGLRYLSASVFTFAVAFAFHEDSRFRRPLTVPVIAGGFVGVTGFIYLSDLGWRTQDVIFFVCEIAITILVGWGCRMALLPIPLERRQGISRQRAIGGVALLCAVLISLSGVCLTADIALGRAVGAAIVLAVGWRLGAVYGAALGVVIGLALDISALGTPLYAMALGLSGLAAGACRGRRRWVAALAFVLAGGVALLWTWDRGLKLESLYEVLVGGIALCFVPTPWLQQLDELVERPDPTPPDSGNIHRAGRRLQGTAAAFRALNDCLRQTEEPPKNDNDISSIFDRTAQRVCRSCGQREHCWEKNYVSTFNAMNDATPHILRRGRSQVEDFPAYFSQNCPKLQEFLSGVDGELSALLYRRQYNSQIQESRQAVCRQYAQLSTVLGDVAVELSQELTPDSRGTKKLQQYLLGLGIEAQCNLYRDHRGLLRGEVKGEACKSLDDPQTLRDLSALLRAPMACQIQEEGVSLIQLEPYRAVAGMAARKKSGETVSGDAVSYFKGEDGVLYLLLCDGMGSGTGARQESGLAVRLLEQFLKAGVAPEQALLTLSSALGLRGGEGGGFTTVDLLTIDLFTGEGGIYKLGSAPTYIRHGDEIQPIVGTSLPAGLEVAGGNPPDFTRIQLASGDCLVMVSDGVCGVDEDGWLRQQMLDFSGDSPKLLARELVQTGGQSATDDKTALVVVLEEREG